MATEYVLAVGVYVDHEEAAGDLRDLTDPGSLGDAVAGAGILRRDWAESELHQSGGGTVAYSAVTGAAGGIVIGVFLGIPLMLAGVGAVVGGLVGRRMRSRETEALLTAVSDTVPVGGTALIAVVPESSLLTVRAAMTRALRTSGRVLDEGPLTVFARGLVRGNPTVMEALDVQQGKVDRG